MAKLVELKSVERFAEKIGLDIALVTTTLAIKCNDGFVERTPVDTGRAQSNWFLSVGSPTKKTTASTTKTEPDYTLIKGDQTVYIQNSLDYIEALENGHSQQSPFGMVGITMRRIQAEIDAGLKTR